MDVPVAGRDLNPVEAAVRITRLTDQGLSTTATFIDGSLARIIRSMVSVNIITLSFL